MKCHDGSSAGVGAGKLFLQQGDRGLLNAAVGQAEIPRPDMDGVLPACVSVVYGRVVEGEQ